MDEVLDDTEYFCPEVFYPTIYKNTIRPENITSLNTDKDGKTTILYLNTCGLVKSISFTQN